MVRKALECLWLCCMVATLRKVRAGRLLQECKCCRSDRRLPEQSILQGWQGREARHVWHALHAILVLRSGACIGWYGPKSRATALHNAHVCTAAGSLKRLHACAKAAQFFPFLQHLEHRSRVASWCAHFAA